MKILITGAGGFIGRYIFGSFLSNSDNAVIAIYRNRKPCINSPSRGKARFIKIENLSKDNFKEVGPVDVVIHAAAHTPLIPNSRAEDYIGSNILGTLKLAKYAEEVKPKIFIYLSTLSLYGEVIIHELDENTFLNKPTIYGLTKYLGEKILEEFADLFQSVCIRLPGVVGKGCFTPWIGRTLRKLMNNESITIYNPNSLFNNIIDLAELKRFITHVIDTRPTGFKLVNLAAREPIKLIEAIDLMAYLVKSRSMVSEEKGDKKSFYIKLDRLNRVFGFKPKTTKEIIKAYVLENI